ncbi:MAG: hypothetical protein IJ555_12715 [Ruminococcus sp.]|nr:hypothetical protein [Ruminococcus sp.]MBR1751821.1 hypothetical protein [Ruminococcus sp.]
MTLLITLFAAIISTVVWYTRPGARKLRVGMLALMYWGASLMWLVDAVAEYIDVRAEYFTPAVSDMINDAYLGLCVTALGLVIWLVAVLVKDPGGVIKDTLNRKS